MARFYRTSNATPIDYMYRINAPLMAQVLGANDEYINQELGQSAKLGAFSFDYIPEDQADATKIMNDYHAQADAISDTIAKDPANWRKQQGTIRDLTKKLQTDYTTGAISKYVSNYNNRKAAFDALDKQVELYNKTGGVGKDGNAIGIAPENAAAYKAQMDAGFKGTKYANPASYNVYKGKTFMGDMNVKKIIADGIDKMKADSTKEYHSNPVGNDWYIDKVTNERVEVTPQRVLQAAMSNLNDPKLMAYMKQLTDAKLASGVFDENGKFIAPYQNKNYELTPEDNDAIEKQKALISQVKDSGRRKALQESLDNQINQLKSRKVLDWNSNSYFTPILQGLIAKNAYSQTEHGNELTNNSRGSTIYNAGQAWARQGRDLAQNESQFVRRQAQQKEEFDLRLGEDRRQADLKAAKDGTKSKDSKPLPLETSVSHFATTSLADKMTNDKNGNRVLKFSRAGLVGDIENNKAKIENGRVKINALNSQLRNLDPSSPEYKTAEILKNQLQLQMQTAQKELDDSRYYYKSVTDRVLNNDESVTNKLKPSDVELYKQFDNDRDASKLTREIEKTRVKFPNVLAKPTGTGVGAPGFQTYVPSSEVQKLLDKRAQYLRVKQQVDDNREEVLSHVRNDVAIDSDAIQPNEKESQQLSDMITSNMSGLRIFDGKTGMTPNTDLTSFKWMPHKEIPQTLTFAGGGDNLQSYIRDHQVKMKVLKVAPTTAIGDGHAVAQVTFDDPNGKIPANKVYTIELNDELQSSISNKYLKSSNPEIANIAKTMGDPLDNSIRNQLAPLATNTVFNGQVGSNNERTITIQLPDANGNNAKINIQKFADGALHASVGGVDQIFRNTDDFINQYKAYLTKNRQ